MDSVQSYNISPVFFGHKCNHTFAMKKKSFIDLDRLLGNLNLALVL